MQAKNEMDQQTQLYQNGMDNTLDQATQDANAAFETLQQAQTDSGIKLVDTDNIQTAEDQLLQLSNEDISDKIKIDVDTTSVDDALADVQALAADGKMGSIDLDFDVNTMSIDDIDSKIEELTNQQKVLTILGDVEGADAFKGWEGSMTGIFADRTITAVYDSKIREYTVKYVSKGLSLQESTAQYGSYVKYTGDTPVYTAEESAYKYNLFKGWDKSGFVDGNKTINAVYETCEYVDGYFDSKDLANMTQVELYTLMKMGLEAKSLSLKDTLDFKLGVDYSYGDIEEHEVISAATKFDGTNYIDTGLKIMEKDRDFTIAIDFEFDSGNSVNSTLAQCFQGDGSNGFRLWYSQEPRFSWNTDSIAPSAGTNREIIVFRHEAGSQKLYVYNSNMTGSSKSQGVTRSTTGWATSAQVMTSTNKYLWCYHEFVLSNNNHLYTNATVIGVYGDKGDPGTTDYNGLQNKPVVNGAVTAYQSDIMKSQLRNVTFSTEEPKITDGKPGDMWVVYGDE